MSGDASKDERGLIARMAKNTVAANVIIALVIIGGLLFASRIQQEVFPEVTLDAVQVQVVYPGASPDEIEEGVVLSIEEAVRGVDGATKCRRPPGRAQPPSSPSSTRAPIRPRRSTT